MMGLMGGGVANILIYEFPLCSIKEQLSHSQHLMVKIGTGPAHGSSSW